MLISKTSLNPRFFLFLRSDKETKLYNVTFSGLGNVRKTLSCQSTGQETILNMLNMAKNRLQLRNRSLGFFLFKTVNNDCLNVGLPVGILSEDENYECEFRTKSTLKATDFMRRYAVNEYRSDWNMRHFFVSLSNIAVGVTRLKNRIHTDQDMRLRVDFFKRETIFEALVRDNRFIEQTLRLCEVICDRKPLEMCYDALHCENKTVVLRRSKVVPGLPKSVLPQPHPDLLNTSVKVENDEDSVVTAGSCTTEPSKFKNDEDSVHVVTAGPSTAVLQAASTSQANSDETFTHLIECAFNVSKTLTAKDRKKLATECGKIFRNFALEQDLSIPALQVRELTKTLDSVGAIFKLNYAGIPQFIGTCFRTGRHYILTNNHVYNSFKSAEKTAVIYFNYEGQVPSGPGYVPDYLVMNSEELDFAILKLQEPCDELSAPCIFSTGVTIMRPGSDWSDLEGQCLQLIGHPNGQPKQIDPMCPVVTTPLDSTAFFVYALRRGEMSEQANEVYHKSKDKKRGLYHVSSFFQGSSGSPGILFQYGKKLLVVMHTRGFYLNDSNKSSIEQGVLFTEIVRHVQENIEKARQDLSSQNLLRDIKLSQIFPGANTWPELMDIDQ